jgi:hypothetical protein
MVTGDIDHKIAPFDFAVLQLLGPSFAFSSWKKINAFLE